MKKQSTNQFTQISKAHSQALTNVVEETLALGFIPVKVFSTADLWNIQRRSKPAIYRRHLA